MSKYGIPTPHVLMWFVVPFVLNWVPIFCSETVLMQVGQYPARVYTDAPPGVPVVQVIAYDNSTGFLTNFRLENKDDASHFKIGTDGMIRTASVINYDVGRTFEFFVYALHDQKADYKHVKVIVSKRNRFSPIFSNSSYSFPVYRYGVGDVIGRVSATDNDVELYNRMFNIFAEGSQTALNYLNIDRTGEITLTRRIPESTDMLDLKVTAVDMGSPRKSGFANVIIDVIMVRHPKIFCVSTTKTTTTLCWKNPMPGREFDGYIVTVRGDISRTDKIPSIAGHVEMCYNLEGTQVGNWYEFRVKVDTPDFWYGRELVRAFNKTAPAITDSCVSEKFSTCSYRTPCENGGTCIPNEFSTNPAIGDGQGLDYSCRCLEGWLGYNCTIQDVCGSNPCGDFGSCAQVSVDKYQCTCQDGYYGNDCQHFNLCLNAPCMNRGTCDFLEDGNYTCQCQPNFSGKYCQTPDPCHPDPCYKDQGRCVVVSEYEKQCVCNDGFYGEYCEKEDLCVTTQPCQSGAKCVPTRFSYICECPPGRMGTNCDLNNPCALDPCQNGGTCRVTNISNYIDYKCDCLLGDSGPECQFKRASSCVGMNCNNGTCITDEFQMNKCACDKGYHGQFCESFDICLTLNETCSGRGSCISNTSNGISAHRTEYTCQCQPGYFGTKCELFNFCAPKVCRNGGECRENGQGQYDCWCPSGEYNELCPNACSQIKCLNGGVCQPGGTGDYVCSCPEDWMGDNCEKEDLCSKNNNPCVDGNCTMIDVAFQQQNYYAKCVCPSNRVGRNCHLNNPCLNSQCLHGSCILNDLASDVDRPETEMTIDDFRQLFHCKCTEGFTGDRCDVKSCDNVFCWNGGSCDNGVCMCQPEYTGTNCQTQVAECGDGWFFDVPECWCENGRKKCNIKIEDCAPGQIEFRPMFGDPFCIDYTSVNMNSSTVGAIFRCCNRNDCQSYSPTCDTRTHCSPNGQPDTVCQYFNSRCQNGERNCTKYLEEKMSCLDLNRMGDRGWIECANNRLLGMQKELTNPSRLTASQVTDYADIVVGQLDAALEKKEIAQIALDLVNSLSNVNISVSREVEQQNGTNKRLRRFLDDYTGKVSLNNGSVTLATDGLVVQATKVEAFQTEITFNPSEEMSGLSISLPKKVLESMDHNITKDSRLQFISYRKSQLFTPKYGDDDLITVDSAVIERQRVISASVTGVVLQNLTEPIRIDIPAIEKGVNHTCVFWDENNSTWSDRGVQTIYDSKTGKFTCLSNHLTSFAVIMSPTPEALRSQIGLTYITYIGSGISMVCLFLTILTYGLFRCLYGEKSGKILLHLCTSLLLLNVVFLVGSVDVSDYSDNVCTAVAILLHYFVLSTLWWMLVEAIEMYRAIVKVFTKYERFYMLKRCLVGWGIPAVIVAATASVDIQYYGMNSVDQDGKEETKICFMTPGHDNIAYYTSLLAPACLIVLINTIVFILVVRVILKPRFQQQITNNTAPFTPAQVRGAFTVMFLLGVTWIFGPLAIGEAAIVFSYLFCISNSLQGCLIFVFRCLFNPEARLAWIQLFKTGTLKRRRGPIKSKYVDSSSSKDGQDSTTRRLSNSANMNLTTTTNYNTSMKLPLFRGSSGGIHAHPHQLHTTNGWHPNLNGIKRDNGYGNGNDCGASVSVSSGGDGSRGSRSGSTGDGSDINSIQSSKHDTSMEKAELKPLETATNSKQNADFNDEFTHL